MGYWLNVAFIVVRSKVHGEQLVLMVQIIVRVFLQMCMGYLEKKMRFDDWGFWVVVGVIGFSWEVVGGN